MIVSALGRSPWETGGLEQNKIWHSRKPLIGADLGTTRCAHNVKRIGKCVLLFIILRKGERVFLPVYFFPSIDGCPPNANTAIGHSDSVAHTQR